MDEACGRRPLTGEFDAHKDTDSKTSLPARAPDWVGVNS